MLCLFANVTVILRAETIEDVVKDYVAIFIISEIDNKVLDVSKIPGFDKDMGLYMSHARAKLTDAKLFDEYVIESG